MSERRWNIGDAVMHARRPEWGPGVVTGAAPAIIEGKRCQRLTIRFQSGGTRTLSSAIADLHTSELKPMTPASAPVGWLEAMERKSPAESLVTLPEAATDPFRPALARLQTTLSLYRFSDQGGSIIEWAMAQTGLADPLSVFNRHQLEAEFRTFRMALDQHLRKLAMELRRADPGGLAATVAKAPQDTQRLVRRVIGP